MSRPARLPVRMPMTSDCVVCAATIRKMVMGFFFTAVMMKLPSHIARLEKHMIV